MRIWLVFFIGVALICPSSQAQMRFGSAVATTPQQPPTLKPWVSRQTTFNIPFSVDLAQETPSEVQLFVSADAGRTWHLTGRQAPTAKHFSFRASGDGPYWFASRTIDAQRDVARVEQLRPELHVIVDTKQPELDFKATFGLSGEINASWKAADGNLDPATLKIEYQVRGAEQWQSVAIDRSKLWQQGGSLVGEMTWFPEGQSQSLAVRAEVADAAGNRAVVNRMLSGGRVATPMETSVLPPEPYAEQQQSNITPMSWRPDNRLPVSGETASVSSDQPDTSEQVTGAANPYYSRQDIGNPSDQPPSGSAPPRTADQSGARPEPEATQRTEAYSPARATGLPTGERPQMTNSLQFQLDYELDAVGPTGVDEVQLWGTRDFGQTWSRWTLDEDRRSPLEIQVEQEGVFGFRVVIVGRNGLATPAPQTGDLADVWVGVDTTKPMARLSSVIYGKGVHAGELDIRWQVSDQSLGERPVRLLFGEHPEGPWNTLAAGLPNSGQHYWRLDPNMPSEIFLRIEVQDDAGNMTAQQLVEPISTRGLVPKAFIRSVRPVANPPTESRYDRTSRYSN